MAACDDNPVQLVPALRASQRISSISVDRSRVVTPGQSAQFRPRCASPMARTRTVTSAPRTCGGELEHRGPSGEQLPVSSPRHNSAAKPRSGRLDARPSRTSSKEMVVVPDGTFRVIGADHRGRRHAAVIRRRPCRGIPGGAVATTNGSGQYRLYGVPPDATIRVTADGYLPSERSLQLTGHCDAEHSTGTVRPAAHAWQVATPSPSTSSARVRAHAPSPLICGIARTRRS